MVRLKSLLRLVKDKIDIDEFYAVYQPGGRGYQSRDWHRKCVLSVINQLGDLGTDLDIQDSYGNTPLLYALQLGCSKNAIISFIERGADVNKANDRGTTPLFYALKFDRDKEIVDKLLDCGANVNAKDDSDMTPLMCALMHNCLREIILRLMRDTHDVNVEDRSGKTTLVYAVQFCQDEDIILGLMDHGANATVIDIDGNTLLHYASGSAWKCISDYLFGHGIGINIKNNRGETPLFVAVKDNAACKVETLLSVGGDPNISDNCGKTPLHVARSEIVINWLIYHGSKLNTKDRRHCTPLEYHLKTYLPDSAKVIIKYFLLLSNESEIIRCLSSRFDPTENFGLFIDNCKKELNDMKQFKIANNLSFYDFCLLKKTKYSRFINISKSDYSYGYLQISNMFPLYFEMILMKMKDNEMEKQKYDLLKNFIKIRITSIPYFNDNSGVEINYDCIEKVAQYLSHKGLYHLFLASL